MSTLIKSLPTLLVSHCLFFGFLAFHETVSADAQSMAEIYPPRVEELQPTPGWAPEFRKPVEQVGRRRVPLQVDWGDNEVGASAVTFGVPFQRNALESSENIRVVDSEGGAVPAGFQTTATWEGPDGPLRWVLGHALLRRDVDYFLEFGTEVSNTFQNGIKVEEADQHIQIDTGPMRVSVSRRSPAILDSVEIDGQELLGRGTISQQLPAVVDGEGNIYVAGDAEEGLSVTLVERGPGRAAVRREGWYTSSEGKRFCKFVTYTYFYPGLTTMRHDHTLIVAFDTNEHTIRDIMLPVALELDPGARTVFATDPSPDGALVEMPGTDGPYSLVQKKHDVWELYNGSDALQKGSRAGGWFGLSDAERGAFVGMSDFWQQYPAELETDGNVLRLHLWPSGGADPLDLRPSSKWQLDDEYPGDHVFHSRWYRDGLDEMTQGYGVGKTHNIHINFFAGDGEVEAQRLTRAQSVEPVIALPDPDYVCSTESFFGRMHPYDPDGYPEIEAMIGSVVDTYYKQRENNEQYGWIHFGDVYNTGRLWRRWGSMFYGFPNVMPRLFLRSGRRDVWDFHRVNTRHITDIDICHLDHQDFKKEKGRRYGGDGGIAHYAADLYSIGCDTHIEFMFLDYYVNGNLRTWEVANDYLEAHAAARARDRAMIRYSHRHTGGALRLFGEGYQATWNAEYLSIMRQLADLLYGAQEQEGATRRDDVYMNPAKILYYQITGDERMRELFLNDMTLVSRQRNMYGSTSSGRGATLSGLAHAYWFTGDQKYLPFFAWQLDHLKEKGIGGLRGNFLARYATHGYQLPQAMALVADVEEFPEPQGPAVPEPDDEPLAFHSNWAYYLGQETDGDFSLAVVVNLHRGLARSFSNRHEWIERLKDEEQQALRVIDPDGREIKYLEVPHDAVNHRIDLDLPADGKTGTYVIVPANMVNPALSWRLAECSLSKRVAHAGDNWTNPWGRPHRSRSWHFTVPAGTERFNMEMKCAILRSEVQYGVRNADGEIVAENRWETGSNPRNEWEIIALDAAQPEEDEVWSLTFRNPGETYLRFDGIPGYVASSPDELFIPDPAMRQEVPSMERPEPENTVIKAETGLPWGGPASFLTNSVTLEDAAMNREMMDREQGTIEMWVKTVDPYSFLSNRGLLGCGSFSLLRRINIGTYASIGGQSYQSFFALPTNRWTHLAFTWRPSGEPGANLEIRLFADGVEVKSQDIIGAGSPHKKVPADWPGENLTIHAGSCVAGLRVSDVVRYRKNFPRPEAPFAHDEDTRILCPFDGSGKVWVFGEEKPLQ